MKIVCDSCGAKYSIADEKVRGKVFKIRCKKCSDVIVVKGKSDGDGSAADEQSDDGGFDSGYGGSASVSEWYAVIDGDQVGPITADEVEAYFKDGSLDLQSYVWREGLDDWEQLSELDAFDHLGDDAAAPDEETVVADPGQGPEGGGQPQPAAGGGENLGSMADEMAGADMGDNLGGEPAASSNDEATVVTNTNTDDRFDFDQPEESAAAGGDFSDHSGEDDGAWDQGAGLEGGADDGAPVDDLAEDAGMEPAAQSDPAAQGDPGAHGDPAAQSDPGGGGFESFEDQGGQDQFEPGGGLDSPGGGFDAGGGMDGGQDGGEDGFGGISSTGGGGDELAAAGGGDAAGGAAGAGDDASFESFDSGGSGQSAVSGGGGGNQGGGSGQGPQLSSDDMVGERSENSVLFSLSSVDEMKAVDGQDQEQQQQEAGAGAATEGSGLIDIQNLAASHAAMSSEEADEGEEQQPSPAAAAQGGGGAAPNPAANQDFSNDSMNMPSLAPSGSRGNNLGLIIAVVVGFIFLSGAIVAAVLIMNRDSGPKKIVQKKTKAAGGAKKAGNKAAGGEEAEGSDESGSSEQGDDKKGTADKDENDESKGEDNKEDDSKSDEGEKEKAEKDQDESESDEGEQKVAQRDDDDDQGGGGGGGGSADRTGGAGGSGGGGGGGGDDDIDNLLNSVDDKDESGGGGGGGGGGGSEPKKDLKPKPTRSMVKNTIGKYSSRIGNCAADSNRNDLSGTLYIKFQIQPSGRVSSPSIRTSKFKGTDVGKCVQKVVGSMKFPETKQGMPVKFPFSVN